MERADLGFEIRIQSEQSPMITILLLSIVGWTRVVTSFAGPWDLLAHLRASWPRGPLSCPVCTGTWMGLAHAALLALALYVPAAASALVAVVAMGAGAAACDVYALAADLARVVAFAVRRFSDPKDPST